MQSYQIMRKLTQKKFSISVEQKRFLENYRRWGYSDRSSIVRDALNIFMRELETAERKTIMKKKAQELSSDYKENGRLTVFSKVTKRDDR
jgi:metal-responsive CopG/Arc/MetJ family transcriptional regulator